MTERQDFRDTFQPILDQYIKKRISEVGINTIDTKKIIRVITDLVLSPGKRMRPYLAVRTALSCGVPELRANQLGVAMELFHDFALVHDDIMDSSNERRGKPTVHRKFQQEHESKNWRGSAERYGISSAILAGDLLFAWSEQALDELNTPEDFREKMYRAWSDMKTEVILGQQIDLTSSVLPKGLSRKQLLQMLALKSGRYSIGRPILLGYALAGFDVAEQTVMEATEPLVLAFQIQDDILGTFGNAKKTGKSTDSDIKEGKMTMLAWETKRRLESDLAIKTWERVFGNAQASDEDIQIVRELMESSGARIYVSELASQLIKKSIEMAYALPNISSWFIELAEELENREV
jgi:geranylgeranyl diphosphate synthase, type I